MTKVPAVVLILGAAVFAVGCEVAPRLEVVQSKLRIAEKKSLTVALVIPEATRSFSTMQKLPDNCLKSLGEVHFLPAPYGEIFEQTLRDRLSRLFTRVDVVSSPPRAGTADVAIEASLIDIGYEFDCTAPSSPDYVEITASLRGIDQAGNEFWRSREPRYRHTAPMSLQGLETLLGRNVSNAVAALVDGWTKEIAQLPEEAFRMGRPRTRVAAQPTEKGQVRRSWLGLQIQAVTEEMAKTLGLNGPRGALVDSVIEDSPAAKSAIKPGDVILRFDGKDISEMPDLPRLVTETDAGRTVEVVAWRDRREVEVEVKVGEVEVTESPVAARPGGGLPPTSSVGDSRPPTKPLALTFPKGPTRPDDIAVIIGNASYTTFSKDIPDVAPANADAAGFKRYVIEALGVREGNILDLRNATGAQMLSAFGSEKDHRGQLYNWVRPGRSNVYVYYAGHGAPVGREGTAYLVPVDANPATIELTAYPLNTLFANLGKLPAKSVVVVLEACFSGVSQAGAVIRQASPIFVRPKAPEVPRNVTVIAAGAADQIASWETDSSHGLFTKYFLKAMSGEADAQPYGNGDGRVELSELDAYLKDTLTYYARRYYGRDQIAQIIAGK